jgi:hypothetical protein
MVYIGALLRRGVVGYLLVGGGIICRSTYLGKGAVVWVGTCGKMCGENLYGMVCIVYEETRSWCTYMALRSCCGDGASAL